MRLLVVFLVKCLQYMVMTHTISLGYIVFKHERYYMVYRRCGSNGDLRPCKIR